MPRAILRYTIIISAFCLLTITATAQGKQIPVTAQISIEGSVKHPSKITMAALKKMKQVTQEGIDIYNHEMVKRKTLSAVSGVLLKELLQQAEIDATSPKDLSEYYIICVAADGYKVVFSWNELFNTLSGQNTMIITGADNKSLEEMDDHIAMIAPHDIATGRRYVKGLSKIIVSRVK